MPIVSIAELDIHYLEQGSGPVLLIFPAHLHAAAGYEREMAHFSDRFRVVAFDYPETGGSTREPKYPDERRFDPWGWWSDVACHLLQELGIESVYALAVGGGARAALHFAGHHARLHELQAQGLICDSFLADLDARTLHRALDVREHYYVRYGKLLEKEHGEDWRAVVDAETAYLRRIADRGGYAVRDVVINAIDCPVLLTGHMKDPLTPGIAREYARLAGLIPNCSIHLASDAGHPYIEYPWMWSNPDDFRAVADRFLARVT